LSEALKAIEPERCNCQQGESFLVEGAGRKPSSIHQWWTRELQFRKGLPDAFCKNTGHYDLSTVRVLSCVVFRK